MAEKRVKMPRPMAVSDLLAAAFHGKPAERRLEEGKIWLAWDAAVGRQIAGKARPVGFRDGILTVAVASAPWMQQLTFLKRGMIERLNERLGRDLVQEIYLKAGRPETPPAAAKQPLPNPRPLLPEEQERIAVQTGSICDPELRESFRNLLIRHLTESSPAEDKP
jgi:predicted nucleic acid-binding Zn ribbon protein